MVTLVTGASGFVGSHVIDALLSQGVSVRAQVRDSAAAQELRNRGVDVTVGDVRDPQVLGEAVRGVDIVYHCAAAVGPAFSQREIHDVGLMGARHLLEGLRQAGSGRAVLLTSVNVLGTRSLDAATEDIPPQRSGDAAADAKVAIEELAHEYEQRHGVDVTVLRPGMIYGPRDRHNVPQMMRALRRGKFAFIGSRDNVAPIVYISDVVQAMLAAGNMPASRGRLYHITDGSRTTIGEFIDELAKRIDCPVPKKVLLYAVPYLGCVVFEWLSRLRIYRGRPPIVRNSLRHLGTSRSFSIERAAKELGYVPRVSYQEGLSIAVKWIEEHSHGHAPVG
ncbi:MAG TPA: NAD(P)-dependent oxidoreductase [Gemmataceae bacterium]|jgi:nucleoside-diphosphate-sugar epimerase